MEGRALIGLKRDIHVVIQKTVKITCCEARIAVAALRRHATTENSTLYIFPLGSDANATCHKTTLVLFLPPRMGLGTNSHERMHSGPMQAPD